MGILDLIYLSQVNRLDLIIMVTQGVFVEQYGTTMDLLILTEIMDGILFIFNLIVVMPIMLFCILLVIMVQTLTGVR